jgi:protein SCO1/2
MVGQACSKVPEQRYEIKGQIVSVDKPHHQATISHGEIKGYMEGMTMPFTIKDQWAIDTMSPGDRITAMLVVEGARTWIENPVITKESRPDPSAGKAASAPEPKPGEEVPDFTLVNQDGKRIRLHQYHGQALALTFIYTRCPLPDYCPLMSSNFAELEKALKENPARYGRAHLLSISVDPDYDKPQVLREYGARYTSAKGNEAFRDWEFASGTAREVKAIAQFFGLSYWTEKDQIIYSLSTAIIGPEGKVFKFYRGNDWQPVQVLREMESLQSKGAAH